jgi:hypothetical protein
VADLKVVKQDRYQLELSENHYEGLVALNDDREELEALERHRIGISENIAEVCEELLK